MSDLSEAAMREQEARIRQLENDAILKALDIIKRSQDVRMAPVTMMITVVGAVAALFGAAAAFVKWLA